MAYNKTVWENDKTPVNAENMNKIEQGIAEAHEEGVALRKLIDDLAARVKALEPSYSAASVVIQDNGAGYSFEITCQDLGIDGQPLPAETVTMTSPATIRCVGGSTVTVTTSEGASKITGSENITDLDQSTYYDNYTITFKAPTDGKFGTVTFYD